MPKKNQEPPRGPMIHIRLDETTHRRLKIRVAHNGTTIQHLVADLIRREVGVSGNTRD
jgi:plasmid stability protein